jgi:hypothetical protein
VGGLAGLGGLTELFKGPYGWVVAGEGGVRHVQGLPWEAWMDGGAVALVFFLIVCFC